MVAPSLLAILLGLAVPYLVGRKFAEQYPSWIGVAASFVLACVAGVVALLIVAFGVGLLLEYFLNLFAVRLDTGTWVEGYLRGIIWVFVGAAVGVFRGRRRAASRRAALGS
jgi:hypothetical protein